MFLTFVYVLQSCFIWQSADDLSFTFLTLILINLMFPIRQFLKLTSLRLNFILNSVHTKKAQKKILHTEDTESLGV